MTSHKFIIQHIKGVADRTQENMTAVGKLVLIQYDQPQIYHRTQENMTAVDKLVLIQYDQPQIYHSTHQGAQSVVIRIIFSL